jgi:hypothetical protein
MTPKDLRKGIEVWTAEHADIDAREYIGMSQVGLCPVVMYRNVMNGPNGSKESQIRAYEGTMHVNEMVERLVQMGVARRLEDELTAFDGRLRGHPRLELCVDGEAPALVLIHSVDRARFDEVLQDGRALRKHYEAAQCYMLHGGWNQAAVIYKCREDGDVWVIMVQKNERVMEQVNGKVEAVLAALNVEEEPICMCGRH